MIFSWNMVIISDHGDFSMVVLVGNTSCNDVVIPCYTQERHYTMGYTNYKERMINGYTHGDYLWTQKKHGFKWVYFTNKQMWLHRIHRNNKKMSMKWEKPFREVFPGPPFRWLSSSSSKELKRLVTPLCLDGWILVPHSWFSWFII